MFSILFAQSNLEIGQRVTGDGTLMIKSMEDKTEFQEFLCENLQH